MASSICILGLFSLINYSLLRSTSAQMPTYHTKKFEYKHSFRGPNLAQRDGTIPYWEILGDAIASSEQLRLAPSMRSKMGAAWNTRQLTESEFWEMEMSFKVTGQGRIGADGLAFWYTAAKGAIGNVFGSNDYWTGLGIFFDSFDNDAQRNNPFIMMMINDGTRTYDHQTDGSQQMLTGCQKDFRNRPFPVKIKIEYLKNILTVHIHDGMTPNERYELCMRAENIFLPRNGFFGLSAATGGLADDHDILSFSVFSLSTQVVQQPAIMPKDEQKKYEEEFQRQAQEFQTEREKFQKEHPDKVKPQTDEDLSKFYEDATQRDIRMIYEGQTVIHQVIGTLDQKLNQIIQQQLQQQAQVSVGSGGQQQVAGGVPIDTFKRFEVNEMLSISRELSASVKDIRNFAADIQSRIITLDNRVSSAGGAVPAVAGGGADQLAFQAQKSYLEGIKHEVEQIRLNQRTQQNPPCPVQDSSCLSPMFFIFALVAQSAAFFVYSMVKGRSEKAKFY